MARLPRPAVRRPISITTTVVATLIGVLLAPLAVPVLYLVDVVTGSPRGRRSRAWLLVTTTLWNELAGVTGATALWLLHRGGRRGRERWLAANYRLEFWWCHHHFANLRRFAGVTIELDDPEPMRGARSIMVARHSSHIDAIIPMAVLGMVDRRPRYTLKDDLQWTPAIDLVGERTHNVWIDRTPEPGSPMFGQIEHLAATMGDDDTAVIFPEGTFRTPARHDRAVARLRERRPDLAEQADTLRHVLPPRPAGTLALMRGAPDADLIVLDNVGTEGRSSIAEIMATIDQKRPIVVRARRYPRAEVPDDPDRFAAWLLDRWVEMDTWIADHRTKPETRR